MPSARFNVYTGSEVVTRESDGAMCGLVWCIGENGRVFDFKVIVRGEGE